MGHFTRPSQTSIDPRDHGPAAHDAGIPPDMMRVKRAILASQAKLAADMTPEVEATITESLNHVDKRIECLQTHLAMLEQRLGPILLPERTATAFEAEGNDGDRSPLLHQVREIAARLVMLDMQVASIEGRLQL